MFRKIAFGLLAAASIGATALLPTSASAHGLHLGWGWGFGPTYIGTPTYIVSSPTVLPGSCLQKRLVETRRGLRWRTVNVCY